jgi:hypothetical protein
VAPGLVSDAGHIIDGKVRFRELIKVPKLFDAWRKGELPHHTFRGESIRADNKLLPRMLVLAGHHDRAYVHTPAQWRDSAQNIRAFLGIPTADALMVFANRHRERRSFVKASHRTDPVMANKTLIRRVRAYILECDETGQAFQLEQLRRIVFNDSTTTERNG